MTPEQFAAMLADRNAGTQGLFEVFIDEDGICAITANGAFVTSAFPTECGAFGDTEANARRIARVPDMENTIIDLTDEVQSLKVEDAVLRDGLYGAKDEITALRAALDKADARKVKALIWDGKDGYLRAHDLIGGFYEIIENDNEFYLSRLSITGGGEMVQYPTLESAISAASGEHTARILSALQ